ncbi:MetQ/NlpA family ABC transporter substrate-binding protein [Klebsiella pneumoniae]|nr:MetQ/NlpA family ABC transporter substrate-binding protein [Klebsiella pneumoniae]
MRRLRWPLSTPLTPARLAWTPAKDGIFAEGKESPHVNLIVSLEDNKDAENVKKFCSGLPER